MLIDFLAQMVNPPPNPDIFSKEEALSTDRHSQLLKNCCYAATATATRTITMGPSTAEEMAINSKFADISRACADGIGLTILLIEEVVRNQRRDRYNPAPKAHLHILTAHLGGEIPALARL